MMKLFGMLILNSFFPNSAFFKQNEIYSHSYLIKRISNACFWLQLENLYNFAKSLYKELYQNDST